MNFSCFLAFVVAFVCLTSSVSTSIQFPKLVDPLTSKYASKQQQAPFNVATYKVVSRSIARIALALNFMLTRSGDKDANIVFSPLNIVQTLSSVMLGTAGITEKELGNFLGIASGKRLDDRNKAYVHKILGNFLRSVATEQDNRVVGSNLIMAGGVFVQTGYPVKSSYIEDARNIYNNDVMSVNFEDGTEAAKQINEWVSDKTNKRIDSIVDAGIDASTKAIITSTLYFNGNWEYPFIVEATKWQKFYLTKNGKLDKKSVLVEMMVNQAEIPYFIDKVRNYEAIGIPYKNKEFYMYIVLPNLDFDLNNVTMCFTTKDIDFIVEKSKLAEVFYVIPKMNLQAEYNLRRPLENLGTRSLFNPQTANFTDIAEGIYASEIKHKVTIDINEIGTVASAATSTSLNRGGYVNFRADRPYFFFIYNVKVGTMVFWGKVQRPTPFK